MLSSVKKSIMPALAAVVTFLGLMIFIPVTTFAADQLVVYPDYPSGITQNMDYTVSVTQGSTTKPVKVYNPLRTGGSTSGDDYRRFSEFSFSGSSVTVNITVNAWTVNSYQILPSIYGLSSTKNGNVITVTLPSPKKFMVKVNGDINTVLSVFADSIETGVPSPSDPNVLYYSAGWYDVSGGVLTVPANKTLYLAPGAVLNARVTVAGSNAAIKGRGMIRDGLWITDDNTRTMICINKGCSNVNIKDVKLIDSRWYNIGIYWSTSGINIDNVKILSNQVSTDGVSFWGGVTNSSVTNSFIYNADNVFVFNTDVVANNLVRDCIVGSTCSIFFPQGSVVPDFVLTDIDVFRCTGNGDSKHGLIRNTFQAVPNASIPELTIKNVRAADCDSIQRLFYANYIGGAYVKKFILKNITLPTPSMTNGIQIDPNSGNYQLVLDNVKYGSTLLTNDTQAKVKDLGTPASTFTYKDTSQLLNNPGFESGTTGWTAPINANIASITSPVRSGSYAAKAYNRTSCYGSGIQQDIKSILLANGQGYYKFSAWLRLNTGSASTGIKILINDSTGNRSFPKYSTVNSTGWTNVSTTQNLTWSGTLNSATLFVETNDADTALPDIYFDDFSLQKQ